jgi:hypothetical protein
MQHFLYVLMCKVCTDCLIRHALLMTYKKAGIPVVCLSLWGE